MLYKSRADLEKISSSNVSHYFADNGNPIVTMHSMFLLECENGDTAFTDPVMQCGYWEAWVAQAMLQEIYASPPGTVFVDVGANVGYYTILMAMNGCNVMSFEPNPAVFSLLERNIALNRQQNNVQAMMTALGSEKKDHGFLNIHHGHSGASTMCDQESSDDSIIVALNTFSSKIQSSGLGPEDNLVIKVDVEGYEREVWDGALDFRQSTMGNNTWFVEWVPIRHGRDYNIEWLTEVSQTHKIGYVDSATSTIKDISILNAVELEFETIVFSQIEKS